MSSLSLKFCKKNLELYSQSVYEALKERYPDEKIEVVDCVGKEFCGTCTDVPFAIRNNALVGGRTARDLFYKLERGMAFLGKLPAKETGADAAATGQEQAPAQAKAAE